MEAPATGPPGRTAPQPAEPTSWATTITATTTRNGSKDQCWVM